MEQERQTLLILWNPLLREVTSFVVEGSEKNIDKLDLSEYSREDGWLRIIHEYKGGNYESQD